MSFSEASDPAAPASRFMRIGVSKTRKIDARCDKGDITDGTSHKSVKTLRRDKARTIIMEALEDYEGVAMRLGDAWGINSGHFSKLLKHQVLTPTLDDLLVNKGLLPKRPPKDPRSRVWMRTDDPELAAGQFVAHYSLEEMAHGLRGALDPVDFRMLARLMAASVRQNQK